MNGDILKWVISKNKEYLPEQVNISPYCTTKMIQRGIDEDIVRSSLVTNKDIIYAKPQKGTFQGAEEDRYKLVYKLSSRYYLILIIVYDKRVLKVINVIKTSKDMEAKWQKKILS